MPCFDYTSNDPIYFSPNNGPWSVEKTYPISGSSYSYASIARICEVPDADQLCVYTRPNPTGTETKLTLGLNYTVNSSNETIVLIGSQLGEIVIRRCTPNNKMLFKFVNGAKITAQQLNASLYQLLFIAQEKEFVGTTVNEYYPISIGASNWSSATNYIPNNYVLYNGNIYRAVVSNTNSAPPNADWALVNPSSNGFVIQGGETIAGPIKFNLANVTTGSSLVWTGSEFAAGTITGFINNLADVDLNNPLDKSILVYDGIMWRNRLPTIDITEPNIIFKEFAFYNRSGNANSYSRIDASVTAPSVLDTFKDVNSQYVLTHAPTVYHIIKKILPEFQDPLTYFANIETVLEQVAANASNPVKAQLYWNLNRGVPSTNNITDTDTGEPFVNYKLSFWDSPFEFYDIGMVNNLNLLKRHGVSVNATTYRDNPFFHKFANSFYSKLSGRGIKSFYLNVPESYNTALCNLPITKIVSGVTRFFNSSDILLGELKDPNSTTYRDEYLTALRDFAFAGIKTPIASSGIPTPPTDDYVKSFDIQSRYAKSHLLSVDYNGWEDVSYKRLESEDIAAACLFKMPKQIIYYNKQAMVFDQNTLIANSADVTWPETQVGSDSANGSQYSFSTRFTGNGELSSIVPTESTTSYNQMGSLYKAASFWGNWCTTWKNDTISHFNEADIEWVVGNVDEGSNINLKLYDLTNNKYTSMPARVASFNFSAYRSFPWIYRSNWYDKEEAGNSNNSQTNFSSTYDGQIGTHHFNVDANQLFSSASSFVPDPRDEYVFRVIVRQDLFNFFNKEGSANIASAIILEHGFDEHPSNNERTVQDGLDEIYRKNKTPRQLQRTKTRLNKNDVKVFIQSEHIEKLNTTTNQYVINICISVPRLKSIGYARIFRNVTANSTDPVFLMTAPNGGGSQGDPMLYYPDTANPDLGPWTFYFNDEPYEAMQLTTGSSYTSRVINIAGRNECAVKFTRLGIPNNLWIRMSVLNTDGTIQYVQPGGTSPIMNFSL